MAIKELTEKNVSKIIGAYFSNKIKNKPIEIIRKTTSESGFHKHVHIMLKLISPFKDLSVKKAKNELEDTLDTEKLDIVVKRVFGEKNVAYHSFDKVHGEKEIWELTIRVGPVARMRIR